MSKHNHSHAPSGKNGLLISIILNSWIVIAEFIGWIMSWSLALLSDAIHNLSDVISLILSYFWEKISKKKSDKKHSFAFKRAEVIIAFVNAIALILIWFYIIYEAINRFYLQNIEINSSLMLIVWFIGFLWNAISIFFLFKEKEDNLNKICLLAFALWYYFFCNSSYLMNNYLFYLIFYYWFNSKYYNFNFCYKIRIWNF